MIFEKLKKNPLTPPDVIDVHEYELVGASEANVAEAEINEETLNVTQMKGLFYIYERI